LDIEKKSTADKLLNQEIIESRIYAYRSRHLRMPVFVWRTQRWTNFKLVHLNQIRLAQAMTLSRVTFRNVNYWLNQTISIETVVLNCIPKCNFRSLPVYTNSKNFRRSLARFHYFFPSNKEIFTFITCGGGKNGGMIFQDSYQPMTYQHGFAY